MLEVGQNIRVNNLGQFPFAWRKVNKYVGDMDLV